MKSNNRNNDRDISWGNRAKIQSSRSVVAYDTRLVLTTGSDILKFLKGMNTEGNT